MTIGATIAASIGGSMSPPWRKPDPLIAAGFRIFNDPTTGFAPAGYACARDVPIWLPQADGSMSSFAANVLPREFMDGQWWNRVDPAYIAGPLQSHALNNAAWSVVALNTPTQDGPMVGGTASWGITETTASAYRYLQQTMSWVSGTSYTARVFASNRTGSRFVQVRFPSAAFGSTLVASFNPRTGAGQALNAGVTIHTPRQVSGGWILSASAVATATGNAPLRVQLAATQAVADEVYTGDGSSGVNIWGVNLTNTSYPVPMVQVGAVAVNIGNHTWAPALSALGLTLGGEFTLYAEVVNLAALSSSSHILRVDGTDEANRAILYRPGGGSTVGGIVTSANTASYAATNTGSIGTLNKLALRVKLNDMRAAQNASLLLADDGSSAMPVGLSRAVIGHAASSGVSPLAGRIGRLAIHQTSGASDALLQSLTA